ncbi:MAG: sigma-70 family RNA polymerase sigma factor [Ruminococcaceae bacterium]|nr:sigma-70 family RNA polymerase sigma factor [Oscillospiraceae bacterium]
MQTTDERIVELYWQRSETAIRESNEKYGRFCHYIAYNILCDREDAEESVNDTWLAAWDNMPPRRPSVLSAFLGKLTRRISIDRWRRRHADKRGGGELPLVLDELADCVSGSEDVETAMDAKETARIIREFLDGLPVTERRVFLRRYWYMDSVAGIAREFDFSDSKTASMLHRMRGKLREKLKEEGYFE